VVAFARWMETTLDVPFSPEFITSYPVEQYMVTIERIPNELSATGMALECVPARSCSTT
jgi:hypothetical protein